MSNDDNDAVFDDTLDEETIDTLLNKLKTPSVPVQRDLLGNVLPGLQTISSSPPIQTVYPPTHHNIDFDALETYLYPTNFELRDYQFNIVKNAFYKNLLVALPTGLGKTFIASTVMLNYHRWFPDSKIIFMAPTRPLVAQQIKSFCRDTGVLASKVATLLDKTRRNRGEIWDSANIFFTTPQVVENDLTVGILNPKSIVLLVIDEAHRAKGNYAYNNVCKFINRFNNSYRILALTATPASFVEGVQEIIDNLSITKAEVRTENSLDISKYLKRKRVERISIGNTNEIEECIDLISTAIAPVLKIANERKIYDITDPLKINSFQAMEASQRLLRNQSIPEGLKWLNFFVLQLLNVVGQALRRLVIYGVRSFYSYFKDKYNEFTTKFNNKKSKNQLAASFYFHDSLTLLFQKCDKWLDNPSFLGHEKLEVLLLELSIFFEDPNYKDSKVIIFTEFRESALSIVRSVESLKNKSLRSHIFIGQAKEKDKFDEDKFLLKGRKKKAKEPAAKKKNTRNKDVITGGVSSSETAQAHGMNQKMQKELIQKFKAGEFNILVATSIGEEGLDIGEVDLIVCYDSTSSPIKNIQRMGRTGRKRDGKVLLLFASNEELKFDKAMGGYEYIQQHIMNGNLITLNSSDRIIPKTFTPIVKRVFIEIPEENMDIVQENDEDEILRIATQYMSKSAKNNKRTAASNDKRGTKKQKHVKQFFLPDNVETNFVRASNLIQSDVSHDKDILDSILLSDSDSEVEQGISDIPKTSHEAKKKGPDTDEILKDIPSLSIEKLPTILPQKSYAPVNETKVDNSRKHLGLRRKQPSILDQLKNQPTKRPDSFEEDLQAALKESIKSSSGSSETAQQPTIEIDSSIAVNYPINISEQNNSDPQIPLETEIKIEYTTNIPSASTQVDGDNEDNLDFSNKGNNKDAKEVKVKKEGEAEKSTTVNVEFIKTEPKDGVPILLKQESDIGNCEDQPSTNQRKSETNDSTNDDSDVFDDGLDDELSALGKLDSDPTYADTFAGDEGFLNQDEEALLYSLYYMPTNPEDVLTDFDPAKGFQDAHLGGKKIGHSHKTNKLLDFYRFIRTTTSKQAEVIIKKYIKEA